MDFLSAGLLVKTEMIDAVEKITTSNHKSVFIPTSIKVSTIRETESSIILYYKDQELKSYSTMNDFYGYKTSIKSAIEESLDIKKFLKIEDNSGLKLKVLTTITERPVLILEEPKEGYKIKCRDIPEDKFYANDEKLIKKLEKLLNNYEENGYVEVLKINALIKIEKKIVIEDKEVWNSIDGTVFEIKD